MDISVQQNCPKSMNYTAKTIAAAFIPKGRQKKDGKIKRAMKRGISGSKNKKRGKKKENDIIYRA